MSVSAEFVQDVKNWVALDDQLRQTRSLATQIRKKKEEVGKHIQSYIESNHLQDKDINLSDGKLKYYGKIGKDINDNDSEDCILICISNILWNVCYFLENTKQKVAHVGCLNLKGYFNAVNSYEEHPKLLDKASKLIPALGCSSILKSICAFFDLILKFTISLLNLFSF